MKNTTRGQQSSGQSELRIRIGGVEIAVTGTSREDCLRQLEAAAREVDEEERQAATRYRLTPAGRRALARIPAGVRTRTFQPTPEQRRIAQASYEQAKARYEATGEAPRLVLPEELA